LAQDSGLLAPELSVLPVLLSIVPFFERGPRPRVFAHRGGCALGPENTIAAFERGLGAGADGLELDVHLSSDGVVVVCHDSTLDRTTNSSGPINRLTAAELSRVDAGYRWADPAGNHPFRGCGVGIPRLRDVLHQFRDVPIIIEMKVNHREMGQAVATEVLAASAVDRVCAASNGSHAMRAAREALPGMATSATRWDVRLALYQSWAHWPVRQAEYGGFQVPEFAGAIRVVSPTFIRHAHSAGLQVEVWTIDEQADMKRLLAWGADALISNRPDLAVSVRDRFMSVRQSQRMV
jgi:glycerophosphoryl diester phosphodiesterase